MKFIDVLRAHDANRKLYEGFSNESRQAIEEHVKRGVPLCDSIFRSHSDAYFETFRLARKMFNEGQLADLDWESIEMLESDIGEKVHLKGVGEVYLDVPYMYEDESEDPIDLVTLDIPLLIRMLEYAREDAKTDMDLHNVVDTMIELSKEGTLTMDNYNKIVNQELMKVDEARSTNIMGFMGGLSKHPEVEKVVDVFSSYDGMTALVRTRDGNAYEVDVRPAQYNKHSGVDKYTKKKEAVEESKLVLRGRSSLFDMLDELLVAWKKGEHDHDEFEKLFKALGYKVEFDGDKATLIKEAKGDIRKAIAMVLALGGAYGLSDEAKDFVDQIKQNIEAAKTAKPHPGNPDPVSKDAWVRGSDGMMRPPLTDYTNEAEYQGQDVELNKPKRGGSKKYYVYVKNPKTGKVKKISFGDPGLKTKSGNKNRAKSFAARHNCEQKKDKMTAGYWACRLPRYGLVKGGKWW